MNTWALGIWTLLSALIPASPWQDWALWELQTRGNVALSTLPLRPIDPQTIEGIPTSDPYGILLRKRLESWWQNASPISIRPEFGGQIDTLSWQTLRAWVTVRVPTLTLDFVPLLRFGEGRAYPWTRWRDWVAGDLFTAAGTVSWSHWKILLGRFPVRFGGFPEGLTLNTTRVPLDGIFVQYRLPWVLASYGFWALDPWKIRAIDRQSQASFPEGTRIYRYLASHRVMVFLFQDRMAIGVSENVLNGGPQGWPPAYDLNPFTFFYAAQYNRSIGGDNVSFDLDVYLRWPDHTLFFGELYLDDVQYATPSTHEPQQIGIQFGIARAQGPWFFHLSYTRVNAWTYLHEGNWQNWIAYGMPLGHPYGPDFDEIFFRSTRRLTSAWDLSIELAYRRKGENTLRTPWPIGPGGWEAFPPGSGFLWGTVEYRTRAVLEVQYFGSRFQGLLRVGWDDLQNAQHHTGVHRQIPWMQYELRLVP